jgi:hypothetical protein
MTFDAIVSSTDEGILEQKKAMAAIVPQHLLEKLSKKSIWHQDGNAAAHMTIDMDRLHDAVYALSLQEPDLITVFDAVAAYMRTAPYSQRKKYKFILPYPAQDIAVQTTSGVLKF